MYLLIFSNLCVTLSLCRLIVIFVLIMNLVLKLVVEGNFLTFCKGESVVAYRLSDI